jgi:colicin import membrane protein
MEMAWAEETQRRIEEAANRAAAAKAAKNKAAAEAAAKKAANAKAAAEEALKKATANKTARRAGLIWRAKARKSLATKAMNKAANHLNEQNKKAEEANKLQRAAERAANNARARAVMANLAAASMSQYTKTESQKARQAANSAKRAQSAAAEKALRANEKKNLNAALKRAIANGNVEAIERMRISALFRETPAGPGRPLLKRSNKQEKVFENALAKAKKVAEAKKAGNRARQGEAKRFAEQAETQAKKFANIAQGAGSSGLTREQLRQSGAAANNVRQAKELQNYIEAIRKGAAARKAKKTEESAVYVQTGGSSRGVVKTPIRSLTPRK